MKGIVGYVLVAVVLALAGTAVLSAGYLNRDMALRQLGQRKDNRGRISCCFADFCVWLLHTGLSIPLSEGCCFPDVSLSRKIVFFNASLFDNGGAERNFWFLYSGFSSRQ